jgi:hypothetical protein
MSPRRPTGEKAPMHLWLVWCSCRRDGPWRVAAPWPEVYFCVRCKASMQVRALIDETATVL